MLFLLVLLLTALLQFFAPWWIGAVVAFGLGWVVPSRSAWAAFGQAFLAVALLWGGYATWLSIQNGGILAERLAGVFALPAGPLMLLVTAVVGGLVAGLGATTGYWLKPAHRRRRRRR